MSYPQIAMAVFIALVSGLICAYAARRMGKGPWLWFAIGFCLPASPSCSRCRFSTSTGSTATRGRSAACTHLSSPQRAL